MHPPPAGRNPPDERFAAAYRSCGTAVLGYALRRCSSREDALDVVAETSATAWRRRQDLPTADDEVRPRLFGIARNCLANVLRGHRRAERPSARLVESFGDDVVPDPATVHAERADNRVVREALAQLPAEDRELIMLVAWEGLTPAGTAAAPGLTPGAARVRLHRARTRLRAALDPISDSEDDR